MVHSYTYENWYKWTYDGQPIQDRQTPQQKFGIDHGKWDRPIGCFRDELVKGARLTLDTYPNEELTLLFSGGSESEMVLRAFLEIGYTPKVVIVRYKDDINLYDVAHAVVIAESLGVAYSILDFDVKRFLENGAAEVAEIAGIDRPRMLPQLAFCDLVDGIPIMGSGDPHWVRSSRNYDEEVRFKAYWRLEEFEHEVGWDRYFIKQGRPAIPHWLRWTPGMVLSLTTTQWFDNLCHNRLYGKLSNWSTKMQGYQEQWPELMNREKKHGFEGLEPLVDALEQFLAEKNGGLIHRDNMMITLDTLWAKITGKLYPNYSEAERDLFG